jgi:hypothetical protein
LPTAFADPARERRAIRARRAADRREHERAIERVDAIADSRADIRMFDDRRCNVNSERRTRVRVFAG